ncbi:MAG TPA: VOC family protein [Vicinamibacterales bacterium]|nr:VOC family protein [Vicinamibacterales bacterium]
MRLLTALGLSAILLSGAVLAQTAAPPSKVTVGLMHAIHATNNVDRTLQFYTDVFGLTTQVAPFTNPGVPLLTNSPGVTLRVAMMRIPGQGFNFELTEFSNTERHPAQPGIADPGAPHMKFFVRDLGAVVAAAKKAGAPMITRGGEPIAFQTPAGAMTGIFFRDPDGYIVQAIQARAVPADAPAGNVIGSMIGESVSTMDASMKFWHDIMGLDATGDPAFSTDKAELDLLGLPAGAKVRTMRGMIPGSNARMEFMEIQGVPKKPFSLRVPDPGASGMAINVANIETLLQDLKAKGVRVLSKDGALVHWSDTVRNVFVKDQDGLNLELVGQVAAAK